MSIPVTKDEPKQPTIPNPPDFRMFRLSSGAPFRCPGQKHKADSWENNRFTVSLSESAVSLTCEGCGDTHVIIVNKLEQ